MKSGETPRAVVPIFKLHARELRQHKLLFGISLVGVVASQIFGLIMPLYLRDVLNAISLHTATPEIARAAIVSVVFVGLFALLQWIADRIQSLATIILESKVMAHLYTTSFEYLIDHSYNFFTSEFAGTLTRRVSKYANAFESIYDTVVTNFLPAAVFVLGAVGILFIHNHILGIMLGIWAVLFVMLQVYLSRLHRVLRTERAERDSKMVGGLADAIGNQNAIALFSGSAYEGGRFAELVASWNAAQVRAWRFMWNTWSIQGICMLGINVALLFAAVILWERGEITVGDFILIQTYLVGTFDMLGGITRQLRQFYDAVADSEEMAAILNMPHEVADIPSAPAISVTEGAILFRDVLFDFGGESPVLDGLDLEIKPGEKVAFVGPSGAGKSTITKLLLRLYDVTGGEILIDGQDIRRVSQESLRAAIAFVPQEPVLFHRSLMENIRYGRRDATDEEVVAAAREAHCTEFIEKLPKRYETFVGERGVKLSGGERQRVAIARAILKNAPILVLDEATSSLDSESESLIQDSLATLMRGKTVIVIAHRLSTIMNMDRIVVLEAGKIVASGTHDELLAQGGLYQKLWSIQAGGFLPDE